jgi:hypothetical protein
MNVIRLAILLTVGVPDNSPLELNVMPLGNVPDKIDHVIGPGPVAVNVVVGYMVPTDPDTKNAGDVMVGAFGEPDDPEGPLIYQLPSPVIVPSIYRPRFILIFITFISGYLGKAPEGPL